LIGFYVGHRLNMGSFSKLWDRVLSVEKLVGFMEHKLRMSLL